jgi:hypothetical protein
VQGIDEAYAKLGRLEGNNVLRTPMEQSVLVLQHDMQVYPPPRTMSLVTRASRRGRARGVIKAVGMKKGNGKQGYWVSSYRRTGTLGRRWTKKVTTSAEGILGVVGNNTVYAPWVQSSRFQAWMHRGRWQTDEQVMERNRGRIVGFFEAAVRRVIGR